MSKVYYNDKIRGKRICIGTIFGDTFVKYAKSTHLSYKYNAYGIQEAAFNALKQQDVTTIDIVILDKGIQYKSPLSSWLELGQVDNLGYGMQRFLPITKQIESKYHPRGVSPLQVPLF